MRKIGILGSGSGDNFRAIYDFFKNKNVEITVISDNLNSDLLEAAKMLGCTSNYVPSSNMAEFLAVKNFDLIVLSQYSSKLSEEVLEVGKFINIHPSLLPAFKGNDAIFRAFNAGVKVSGVTVHWVSNEPDGGKIIAQYPVLIGNTTHYDEFQHEIITLENLLYPKVIDAILQDKVFDFSDLITNSCGSSGCGGCGSCNH